MMEEGRFMMLEEVHIGGGRFMLRRRGSCWRGGLFEVI